MGLKVSGELGVECMKAFTGADAVFGLVVKDCTFDIGVVMDAIYKLEGWDA